MFRVKLSVCRISIHAPPRGATRRGEVYGLQWKISIHAPPRGATRDVDEQRTVTRYISIHAPPRGATRFCPYP